MEILQFIEWVPDTTTKPKSTNQHRASGTPGNSMEIKKYRYVFIQVLFHYAHLQVGLV